MKVLTRGIVPLMILLVPALLPAAVVDRLDEATVRVADQSPDARTAGMQEALGVVLVRMTGQRAAPQLEVLQDVVRTAPRFVQQFRFEQRSLVDPDTGERQVNLFLWTRFDAAALQRVLVERGVPIWGRERPVTLVWLAWDDGFERGLVDETAPPALREALDRTAALRGITLVWPIMDLQDRAALAFADVWGGFEDRIHEASARYQPNAILVGRAHRVDAERWVTRWVRIEDDGMSWFETAPALLENALGDGVHWTADAFGTRFALVPDLARDGRTRLTVIGVDALGDYAAAMQYLAGLSAVIDVALERVEGDRMVFALELRGTEQQLEQAISLGGRLRVAGFDPSDTDTVGLRYRLIR